MKCLLILGRQANLGLAELESVLGSEHVVPFGSNYALSDLGKEEIPFKRLGGSVKLCEIIQKSESNNWQMIEKDMVKSLLDLRKIPASSELFRPAKTDFSVVDVPSGTSPPEKIGFCSPESSSDRDEVLRKSSIPTLKFEKTGKITCGLSVYGISVGAKDIMASGLRIKKALKKATGQSIRLVPNQGDSTALTSAQVLHNSLLAQNGAEIVIVCDGTNSIICRTVDEQDIIAYSKRDQNRPKRDARIGMLPPKLAQIILNLGVGQLQKPLTVLDPFCGTGVVLQEAALCGYNLYGSDLEARMVEYTAENLQWLNDTHKLPSIEATLQTGDATEHKWKEPFNAVACEGYLGSPFTGFPTEIKLREVTHTCNQIAKGFLKNIASQIPAGTRICIALPAWHRPNGAIERLKLLDQLSEMGYNRVSFAHTSAEELLYYRPDQVVARDLLVITRK